jgi:hypothetical protein
LEKCYPQSLFTVATEREFRIEVTRSWIVLIELNKIRGLFESIEKRCSMISWSSRPTASLSSLIAADRNTEYDSTHDIVAFEPADDTDERFPLRSAFLHEFQQTFASDGKSRDFRFRVYECSRSDI